MNTSLITATAGLATLCLLLTTPGVADTADHAIKPRQQAVVIPDGKWADQQVENNHDFKCGAPNSYSTGYVLIGRRHYGDEREVTAYLCAHVDQNGVLGPPVDEIADQNPPSEGNYFTCPINKVMTGREHKGDENYPEWLKCATLKDGWGNDMKVTPGKWSDTYQEHNHEFKCPSGSVMIGKYHKDDEEGPTQYRCGQLW